MSDNNMIISNQEIDILKNMLGKKLKSYQCDQFVYAPMVYGIVGLFVDDYAFKLTSLLINTHRFLNDEDVAIFKLERSNKDDIKSFMDNGNLITNPVESKIVAIDVINDYQTVEKDGTLYSFNSTIGLIFYLENTCEISFEIGTWFSEMITIRKGYNLIEKMTPIRNFYEEWEDCDGYIPKCNREVIRLKTEESLF